MVNLDPGPLPVRKGGIKLESKHKAYEHIISGSTKGNDNQLHVFDARFKPNLAAKSVCQFGYWNENLSPNVIGL